MPKKAAPKKSATKKAAAPARYELTFPLGRKIYIQAKDPKQNRAIASRLKLAKFKGQLQSFRAIGKDEKLSGVEFELREPDGIIKI